MRVKKDSTAASIAGAITGILRSGEDTTLECVGVAAVHQAVKGMALAEKFLEADNLHAVCYFTTDNRFISGKEFTAFIFHVKGEKING